MAERTVGNLQGGVTRRGFLGRTVTFGVAACAATALDPGASLLLATSLRENEVEIVVAIAGG